MADSNIKIISGVSVENLRLQPNGSLVNVHFFKTFLPSKMHSAMFLPPKNLFESGSADNLNSPLDIDQLQNLVIFKRKKVQKNIFVCQMSGL